MWCIVASGRVDMLEWESIVSITEVIDVYYWVCLMNFCVSELDVQSNWYVWQITSNIMYNNLKTLRCKKAFSVISEINGYSVFTVATKLYVQ